MAETWCIPPFSSHLTPVFHSLQQPDHVQETFSAMDGCTNFVFLRSSALSVDGGWDPYSQCHVLGLIPSPPNVAAAFRLTAICCNARHRTHKNIPATTHRITSGNSTNQTTTVYAHRGGALPFGLAVPHSRPVALNLEPSPLAWICLPPGINTTLGSRLARGNMIRSRRCCLCLGPLPDRPAYWLDGLRICRNQDGKEENGVERAPET